MSLNTYYDREFISRKTDEGEHRALIGGMWDEIGQLQLDFMLNRGLKRDARLLDIGCGCLRGGVRFIDFLDSGKYYGMDLRQELLDAGYDVELAKAGLQEKLSRDQLICDEEFCFDRIGATFDEAMAQSVFTHLPLNHIRLCLRKLAPAMRVGGRFHATFFECHSPAGLAGSLDQSPGTIVTHPERDPFHYQVSDFEFCIRDLPWELEYIGEWGHPRGQRMVAFHRRTDGES